MAVCLAEAVVLLIVVVVGPMMSICRLIDESGGGLTDDSVYTA